MRSSKKTNSKTTNSSADSVAPEHLYYGAANLLDAFAENTGLVNDLEACFPEDYKKILSIVFFLIREDNNSLRRFKKWQQTHKHPYGKDIPLPEISKLFASITEEQVNEFLRRRAARRTDEEYWIYESTGISGYSGTLQQVQSDEENDEQPQTNLLLVFGEESELPFYYRRLAGNIPDVKTVKHLLKELDTLGFGKAGFVLDGGFYSEDNINGMYQNHTKFLIKLDLSAPFVRNNFDKIYDVVRVFSNYDAESETYGFTATTEWNYKQKRPFRGDEAEEKRRIYIHYYYNVEKSAVEERLFNNYLSTLYNELTENRLVEKNKKAYEKFFEVKETPDNGRVVSAKKDEVKHALRYLGYFTLVTNEKMDTFTALHLYKMKDTSKKAFGNIKERLSTGRSAGKSEMSSDGKIFTEFIALTLTSYMDHIMMEGGLYKGYTMREFLDKLDAEE